MKKIVALVLFLFFAVFTPNAFAQRSAFVSVVNPVRGADFWEVKNQEVETAVFGQIDILDKFNLPATWLLRFDALDNKKVVDVLKERSVDEKGLFLEITPAWTNQANIEYRKSDSWHSAGSAFLTGYERNERERLIDSAFEKFKSFFDYYPVSVGAWWIDSYSLEYMQKKYGIVSALIVADQYSTDNYQIWGQYFGTPYYPSKNNALHPAQNLDNKLDVVITQWASRDPVNGYGSGVIESTFSMQANDYIDYHDLDINYFSSLIDIYTKQKFNRFSHLVVGLENSYEWKIYVDEYANQIETLREKQSSNQLSVIPMKDFANWYRNNFPKLSPEHLIITDDPLGSFKKTIWFMNPYYRVGWFYNLDGSVFRDIRQYIDGEEELCFKTRCDSINFATSATRVLDDVSFGKSWKIDEGKIDDFKVERKAGGFVISYTNAAGNLRTIELLPRDIGIDGKVFSIDSAILNATKTENIIVKNKKVSEGFLNWSLVSLTLKLGKFLLFLALVIFLPGLLLSNNFLGKNSPIFLKLFISSAVGFVVLTLLFYLTSMLQTKPLIFAYIFISFIIFFRFRFYNNLLISLPKVKGLLNLIPIFIILLGTIFQAIPVFKSGLKFSYGVGFWGPNTHDGVWHLALINQLIKAAPVENPIFSGTTLKNYHFFYDLLVAATNYLSGLPVIDLLFRFYPIVFSLMLGIGSYYLLTKFFENRIGAVQTKVAAIFGLYLIYFAGSFGWIVEFLREKHLGGESAFWVNQSISFNLNPPFAVSLVIMIALFHILFSSSLLRIEGKIITIILFGTLISFKSYTGILLLGSLSVIALVKIIRRKGFSHLWVAFGSITFSAWLFLSNFQTSSSLIVFSPFWFVHSMVDSPDRVGWVRLSLARVSSYSLGQWPKFISAEALGFAIFILGNLGMRFFSMGFLFKTKEILKDDDLLFVFVLTLVSIMIPVLFIQSGNPWNTIQFFYPALYIAALFSGVVISVLVFKMNKIMVGILISIILILAPINSVVTANGYLENRPHAFIPLKELEGLQFLSNQPDGAVMTYPYDEKLKHKISEPWPILAYDSTAYVSAFSEKSVYLEDEPQNQILLTDHKKRLVASKDFFLKPISEGLNFLQENNIKYVYLPKIFNIKLDESSKVVKNIFENEEVVIYKVN